MGSAAQAPRRPRYPEAVNIEQILNDLRQERDQLSEAIFAIERMAASGGKRRGRPPAWMVAAKQETSGKRRGRPPGSKNKTAA
jgi:hypothetical protein